MFKRAVHSQKHLNQIVRHLAIAAVLCLAVFTISAQAEPRSIQIAVLDFGASSTGARAAAAVRKLFVSEQNADFYLVDSDLTKTAALGVGFQGSLNLTLAEARDLGASIGCDFYFLGDAETLRRVPLDGPAYFDSFASIFLVSARTGRLILWERPLVKRDSADEAERLLLQTLQNGDTASRYKVAIRRALEDERAERTAAVESPPPVIDVMSEEESSRTNEVRPPRPFRRFKPTYPESASVAGVEAIVDVLVDVDARGEIRHLEIARWAGYGLDQAVIDTVKQMHFFPAMRGNVAVPMRVLLRYNFRKPN